LTGSIGDLLGAWAEARPDAAYLLAPLGDVRARCPELRRILVVGDAPSVAG